MASVLIVDDEKGMRDNLEAFIKLDGHEVSTAADVEIALEKLKEGNFDVVVSDIIMPRMSGVTLLQKAREYCSYTQFILITGEPNVKTASEAVRLGAFDYIPKPVRGAELRQVVNAAAESARRQEKMRQYHSSLEGRVAESHRALEMSEEKLRTIINHIPIILWALDEEGRFTMSEGLGMASLGMTPETILGMKMADLYAEDREVENDIRRAFAGETFSTTRFVKNSVLDSFITSFPDEQGKIRSVIGVSLDVTERHRAEKAMRESEERFKELFRSMRSGVVIYSVEEDGKRIIVKDINTAAEALDCIPREGIIGRELTEIFTQAKGLGFADKIIKVWSTGLPEHLEPYLVEEENFKGWRENYIYRLPSSEIISIFDDVSDRKEFESKLQEQIQFLEAVLDTIPDPFYYKDTECKYLGCNSAYEEFLGKTREELIGRNIYNAMPREYAEIVDIKDHELLKNSGKQTYSSKLLRADGEIRDVLYNKATFAKPDGSLGGLVGLFRDVTDFNLAQEQIRLQIGALEAVASGIVITDYDGLVEWVNPAFTTLTGYALEEMIGKKLSILNSGHQNEDFYREMRACIISGRIWRGELVNKKKDGNIYFEEMSITPVYNQLGEINHFVAVKHDITQRKSQEEKIREYSQDLAHMVEERTVNLNRSLKDTEQARDRIDAILKSVSDGLIVTDNFQRVIIMNRAAEEMLGIRFSQVINRSIDFAIRDLELRKEMKTALESSGPRQLEFKWKKEGSLKPMFVNAGMSKIIDKDGRQTGTVTILHDVTHEHDMDQIKNELISTTAHELRTPLTAVRGFSELLLTRKDLNWEEKEQYLLYINEQSKRLDSVIKDLMDLSRLQSGEPLKLSVDICSLNDIIFDIAEQMETQTDKHKFELSVPEQPMLIKVDRDRILHALRNIISNAIKFSPAGGSIGISCSCSESEVDICVEDHGIGMEDDVVKKIFSIFYKADISTTAAEGAGIGLSIVKQIIDAHEGQVLVKSKPGEGTLVCIKLPLFKKLDA